MKKRTAVLTVLVVCVLSLFVGAVAADVVREIKAELRPDFTIVIDGEKQVFRNVDGEKVYPILYDGTTYLPIRAIGELMGKTVYWYEGEKKVELRSETDTTTVTDADVIVPEKEKDAKLPKPEKEKDTKLEKEKDTKPQKVNKPAVDESDVIGEERAKEIALEKAELKADEVTFRKVKLDRDDGLLKYEIEFIHNTVEYEAEVNATNGTIIEWDVDFGR